MKLPEIFEILIITLSDRASRGEYEDLSGPKVKDMITGFFSTAGWSCNIRVILIPDEMVLLKNVLIDAGENCNIIITTGGTGIGPRDITVETVAPLLSKEIPGIMEFIRIKYGSEKPGALLSRGDRKSVV
jgi:molybdopterin adenylyltransferase